MSEKYFLDTNIVIYLYSNSEPVKKEQAEKLLKSSNEILISTQVINEFVHVLHHKRKTDFKTLAKAVRELSETFSITQITFDSIEYALKICNTYKYSYFDSLIIASAIENGCTALFTEDLHDKQFVENTLTIRNPFKMDI